MSEYFVGQLVIAGYDFAPRGQAACNGALLAIAQNQALFSLLGINFGGNGSSTFGLPDLRGRAPVGFAPSRDPTWSPQVPPLGGTGGVEGVTLALGQMAAHSHVAQGTTNASATKAPNTKTLFADTTAVPASPYGPDSGTLVALAQQTLGNTGGSAPHPNLQPLLVLNFNIALNGIYPSRN
jgi:microcystin-dependent protein